MFFFQKLPIRYKLATSFLLSFFIFCCVVVYLLTNINTFEKSFATQESHVKKQQLFTNLDKDNNILSDAVKSYMLTHDKTWQMRYNAAEQDMLQVIQSLRPLIEENERTDFAQFESASSTVRQTEREMFLQAAETDNKKALSLFSDYQKQQTEEQNALIKLTDVQRETALAELRHTTAQLHMLGNLFFGMCLFLFVATMLIALGLGVILEKSIKNLIAHVNKIAGGDFQSRVPIESHDELGKLASAFNFMAEKLQESYLSLEGKVKSSTAELQAKVAQIGQQNQDLSNAKQALTNLLTDAQGLQIQLQKEKEGVELKVKVRTQQLRDEESRFEASINSLKLGYIMVDNLFNVININGAAKQILTIENVTVEPDHKDHLTLQYLQERFGQSVKLVAETERCLFEKRDIEIKDILYNSRYFQIFISPIDNVTNVKNPILEVIGAVILIEDVTDAKVLERSRDEFFSIASHELRTPLTVIRGNTSMIKDFYSDKLNDPNLKEMIEDTHDSSIRLITIVNDFLDVSRLEQGRTVFKKEPFVIEDLIAEVLKELSGLAATKHVELKFDKQTTALPEVMGDHDRAKQIILNLTDNAIKYTDKGSVTLSLSPDLKQIKVLITDTGKGIPQENMALLFRKFQQASNNILTRDNTRSTGLGLYIAKLMAEGMGGKVTLERSQINVGSTFALTLPIAEK